MAELLLDGFVVGIGATLIMDIVALVLKHGLGVQPLDYALVGRWTAHLTRGRFVHRPITSSPAITGEKVIGWGIHYLTGVVFALAFLSWAGAGWLAAPDPGAALVFGALTVLAPFLILQPGMGAGLAARRTPRPGLARLRSLLAHLSFGAGIWLAALCWSAPG